MKIKFYLLLVSFGLVMGVFGAIFVNQKAPPLKTSPEVKKEKVLNKVDTQIPKKPKEIDPELLRTPTIEEIFDDQIKDLSGLENEKLVTIIATGDVIPARTVNYKMTQYNNFRYPFEKTADVLKNADITLINLEAPLIKNCPLTNTGMIFCGDQRFIEGLLFAGVDVANIANNHIGNYGQEGIKQTQELLGGNNILTTGDEKITYKRVGETKIAFLGYNGVIPKEEGISWIDKEKISGEVKEAKNKADLVIVSFHWGKEYTDYPQSAGNISPFDPIEIAHQAIDSGADLIVGNHPHWVQGIEFYKEKLITYAHGNFIFDQMWSQKTREGVIGKYIFYENSLIEAEFIPIIIKDYAQPALRETKDKNNILNQFLF